MTRFVIYSWDMSIPTYSISLILTERQSMLIYEIYTHKKSEAWREITKEGATVGMKKAGHLDEGVHNVGLS